MPNVVSHMLQWLNAHPELAGLFTFIISAAESVAIVGTIVPGSIMMTAIGALAGAGVIPLWQTILMAILGAIMGDGISYWVGFYFKGRLHRLWPFSRYEHLLKGGEKFFHRYGGMSVFIGRFVGPVRALVPLVGGMMGMKPLHFIIANVASAFIWAPAYMTPGILLGAASLELPPDIAIHVILVLFLLFLFLLLCLWFIYKLYRLIHNQLNQLENKIWDALKRSRHFSTATVILKYHDQSKAHGQLDLMILLIFMLVIFFGFIFYVKLEGSPNIMVNDVMFHLFHGLSIRTEKLDETMIHITMLGDKKVLLPAVFILLCWLGYKNLWRPFWHTLALTLVTLGSIFSLKRLLHMPRPLAILDPGNSFSMPSGHATFSATFFMGLALLMVSNIRYNKTIMYEYNLRQRFLHKIIFSTAFIIIFLVGLSRIYLGAHWLTDVLAAWLLSASLLTFFAISYQRHVPPFINAKAIVLVAMISLILSFGVNHHYSFPTIKNNYTQLIPPEVVPIKEAAWWQKNNFLPSYRTSLFGFRSQQINIEWAGSLDQIRNDLIAQGWTKPPARDIVSTLHRIADISSSEYLPMVSPQYLDKQPVLVLTYLSKEKRLFVIRLWDSNRIIKEKHQTLWVGVISIVPRSYSWLFKKRWIDMTIDPQLVFPLKTKLNHWQWKLIIMNGSIAEMTNQKIMLIKPK